MQNKLSKMSQTEKLEQIMQGAYSYKKKEKVMRIPQT